MLPHYAENFSENPRELDVSLTARTLILGIFVTTSESRIIVGTRPTNEQLLKVLGVARADLGVSSEDELCVTATSYLRNKCGPDRAIRSLRRAIQLVPTSTFCRADLITSLFSAPSRSESNISVEARLRN